MSVFKYLISKNTYHFFMISINLQASIYNEFSILT